MRQGWWGGPDTRPRCPKDDKVIFESQEKAETSAAKIRERGGQRGEERFNAYQGRCGYWHVGKGR